jgi:hypothetical protein
MINKFAADCGRFPREGHFGSDFPANEAVPAG